MHGTFFHSIDAGIPAILATASDRMPFVVLILCVMAGIGTSMLLPSRTEASWRKIGGAIVIAAAMIGVALLIRTFESFSAGINVYFWPFSAIALIGAMRVITHPRPVYSALYFVLTVFASAGLFILLWAEFMAAALVLIYAGAILVTYVFVIMLAAQPGSAADPKTSGRVAGIAEYDAVSREPVVASAVGFLLMALLLIVIFHKSDSDKANAPGSPIARNGPAPALANGEPGATDPRSWGQTQKLGKFLFEQHLINLELAGLILTMSVVGAIVIARRKVEDLPPTMTELKPEEVLVGPTPINDDPHSIPVYGTDNPRQKEYPET